MARLDDDIARARELLGGLEEAFGPISARKMFGGAGLYVDGAIFAVLVRGELMLKGDATLGAAMEAAGASRWAYVRTDAGGAERRTEMPYWRLPDAALDDEEAALDWARRSARLALDAPRPRPRRARAR